MQDDSDVPVAERVAEEEEVAPLQLHHELRRNEARDVRPGQVIDVVVLRDDVAVAVATEAVDGTVKLQDHRTVVERDLDVLVRALDYTRTGGVLAGRDVPEPATMLASLGHVPEKVIRLVNLLERALERVVVVRRNDELVRRRGTAFAHRRREPREKTVQPRRLVVGV